VSEVTERPAVLVACADSLEYLRAIPDGTYHACVTDPPYGLGDPPDPADVLQQWATAGDWHPRSGKAKGFMGAAWDKFVPGPAIWREVYRVLKPGAYCAVFAGTRTWDWMSLALRFAGFEVTDTLMWLHGQGFPKGGDVGKRIDAMLGAEREVVGSKLGRPGMAKDGSNQRSGWDVAFGAEGDGRPMSADITAPATPEAARWHDCSTTLKPAWEPILLAQKPHEGSAARNCVEHGAGALRVGACRIAAVEDLTRKCNGLREGGTLNAAHDGSLRTPGVYGSVEGRWPANIALDEEAAAALDEQSGSSRSRSAQGVRRHGRSAGIMGAVGGLRDGRPEGHDDEGGASRFFYCAKANKGDRDEGLDGDARNRHPTVKPEALMRWLARLVCPPWGELLDPFAGSGSTGKAAALEGLRATCVEREPDFAEVARARVAAALRRVAESAPAEVAPTAAAA
jgi:site-specific DNA-methyltransferase (adenine-specific)